MTTINFEATGISGYITLHAAAEYGDTAAIEVLIARGSDVNAATVNGWIPLHFASLNGQLAAIEKLIAMGSDANAPTTAGRMPLYYARNTAAIEFLIANGGRETSLLPYFP